MEQFIAAIIDRCYACCATGIYFRENNSSILLDEGSFVMNQGKARFCPECGNLATPDQRFCSNCGTTLDASNNMPTASISENEIGHQVSEKPTEYAGPPPPPPSLEMPFGQPAQPSSLPPNTYYPNQNPVASPQVQQGGVQPVADYAKPQKDSSKGVLRQLGCGVGLVILLVLVLCGGLSYGAYRLISNAAKTAGTNTNTNSSITTGNNGNSNDNGTPTAIVTTTARINQSITYASDDITIVSVQEASSYPDDANPSTPVTLRLNIKEHNGTPNNIFINYNSSFRLVLPDKNTVPAANTQHGGSIVQAVTQTNWIDFPLNSSIAIDQLALQIGGQSEAQMNIPLTGHADLSAYQLKKITPNTAFQYAGLPWTLLSVTSSWSASGKQADAGMRYIVLTMKVDNTSSNTYFPSISNYARLKQGSITNSETSDTFSTALSPGTTGSVGTVTFEMSQSSNAFTLIMLAQPNNNPPVSQQTVNFQI
jgi:hypothetical protein